MQRIYNKDICKSEVFEKNIQYKIKFWDSYNDKGKNKDKYK